MKAVLSRQAGDFTSLVLEEVPSPTPGPGQAVVAVKACSINFPDVLMIEDKYQAKPPRPFAPGGELSGVIAAIGEGVTNVKVGDRVLAQIGSGALVEHVSGEIGGAGLVRRILAGAAVEGVIERHHGHRLLAHQPSFDAGRADDALDVHRRGRGGGEQAQRAEHDASQKPRHERFSACGAFSASGLLSLTR